MITFKPSNIYITKKILFFVSENQVFRKEVFIEKGNNNYN